VHRRDHSAERAVPKEGLAATNFQAVNLGSAVGVWGSPENEGIRHEEV
jgi:hypothetical protein